MSGRIGIVLSDDEYQTLVTAARRQDRTITRMIRESLRLTLSDDAEIDPQQQIAAVLQFARFNGPTGDIEQILMEIGRDREITE